jgi:hypothetical protein
VCLLLHVLIGDDAKIVTEDRESFDLPDQGNQRPRETSFYNQIADYFHGNNDEEKNAEEGKAPSNRSTRRSSVATIAQHHNPDRDIIYENKGMKQSNLTVGVEQVSILLTEDGTVITFFQQSGRAVEAPLAQRLSSASTILRTSEDPSLLLQSVIDAVVDLSFPIAAAYQELISDLVVSHSDILILGNRCID